MSDFLEYIAVAVVLVIFFQMFYFAITSKGVVKQTRCQNFGIVFSTLGIFCLIFRQALFVMGGLLLLMMGLKLIAHGLDRIDKRIFITRYNNDQDDNHP